MINVVTLPSPVFLALFFFWQINHLFSFPAFTAFLLFRWRVLQRDDRGRASTALSIIHQQWRKQRSLHGKHMRMAPTRPREVEAVKHRG